MTQNRFISNRDRDRLTSKGQGPFPRLSEAVLVGALALAVPCHGAGAAEPQAQTDDQVVATVNGEPMLLDDLERSLGSLHESATTDRRRSFDIDRMLFKAVNDMLLGQEARALGMDQEDPTAAQVSSFRNRLVVGRLERLEITDNAKPAEEEIRQAFETQYREITLRVVTAYERQGADEMLAELRGGADMEALARKRSVDPYKLRGGLVNGVPRIDLQTEIAELALQLEPGELGGPVRTDLGWSVIRLEEIREADPERFPKLERQLSDLVRHRKAGRLRAALAQSLSQRHPVTIDEKVAGSVRAERLPDARLVPRVDDPDAVVARVGDKQVIAASEYTRALLARWTNMRNEEAAIAAAPIVLDRMIEQRLLLAEALARGYAERPEIIRTIKAFETELLVPRYLEEVVAAGVEVSLEEMRAHYEAHKTEYRKPPRIHLGQITVATEEEAERIVTMLRQGTDLAWLARQHSIDRFKGSGGDRGWVEPRIGSSDRHLIDAKVGEVIDPLGSPDNFIVLKVVAREEQGIYSFKEVSGNVKAAIYSQKMRGVIGEFMEILRSRSEIEINEEMLESLSITGEETKDPQLEGGSGGHGN